MSKGVFSSQNQSKHTHKCSLRDQRGREFLKADHKLIVFLTAPFSQRNGQIPPRLSMCLTTPRTEPGLGAHFRSKPEKPESRRWPVLGEWSTGNHTKTGSTYFSDGTEKSLLWLCKIHNNVTFTFVPLMSFLTQRLCDMLDSQALAFNVTFDKSFTHFFSTDTYWTNSAICQKHKDEYPPGLLLESSGDDSNLLHLQTTSSFQSTSHTSSNLILRTSLPGRV